MTELIRVNKTIDNVARLCHAANRVLQAAAGDPLNPVWDDLDNDLKNSTYIGVMKVRDGANSVELHESWMKERIAQGWKYGPVLDRELKLHPNLVPYDYLSDDQRIKDMMFETIVRNYRK